MVQMQGDVAAESGGDQRRRRLDQNAGRPQQIAAGAVQRQRHRVTCVDEVVGKRRVAAAFTELAQAI
jgi:hypothetical protein